MKQRSFSSRKLPSFNAAILELVGRAPAVEKGFNLIRDRLATVLHREPAGENEFLSNTQRAHFESALAPPRGLRRETRTAHKRRAHADFSQLHRAASAMNQESSRKAFASANLPTWFAKATSLLLLTIAILALVALGGCKDAGKASTGGAGGGTGAGVGSPPLSAPPSAPPSTPPSPEAPAAGGMTAPPSGASSAPGGTGMKP
jgi:hypothetical protein